MLELYEVKVSRTVLRGFTLPDTKIKKMINEKPTYEELEKQIVEFKKQNQLLKQYAKTDKISDNKYRKMIGNIGDVIVIIDKNGNNAYKSPSVEKYFGWKPEELLGKSTFANIHPEDIEIAQKFIATIIENPKLVKTAEIRYKCKNGSYRWIQFTCSNLLNDPDINGLLGNYHDITEQKTAIRKLIETKEKADLNMEMILNSQSLANICSYSTNLIETDIEKSSWVCSPEFYKIFGIDKTYPHTIAGWAGFIHPNFRDELVAYHESVVKNRTSFDHEYKIIRINDGVERWVKGTGELVYDEHGNPVRMHGAIQDITEIKHTEYELIKAKEKAEESDRLKTEFINNMSHEIRTPMNGILGFSDFLNNENLSQQKRRQYINIIRSSGNQLMRIIDDILEISKLETKQVVAIDKEVCLNDVLLEQFSVFDIKAKENRTPLYLNKGLSDKESLIFTDETKLNKILSNLLENALKYTNNGFIEFGYHKKNSELEIYVKDTGIGIKPENQETIFIRFSQEEKELSRNVGGLGLGLSIAKENAELLNGKITLQSEKGKGSTFFVTIPYKPVNSESEMSDNEKDIKTEKQNTYTILVVEDEEINYLFIEILLVEKIEINCNILHAKHGKEAVDICKENSEINFVLMDLKMPVMNGFEATKLIKEFQPDLPIVAQTAYTTNEDKEKAFSAGCDDFISKPISEETLNEIMNKYLITK